MATAGEIRTLLGIAAFEALVTITRSQHRWLVVPRTDAPQSFPVVERREMKPALVAGFNVSGAIHGPVEPIRTYFAGYSDQAPVGIRRARRA